MVQELLPLLPKLPAEAAGVVWTAAATVAAGGLFLWLMGSWFNRSLIALLMVAAGGVVGMQLPRWFAWPVQTWATAVGGAIVLGLIGFALHRLWAGLAFGLVLALWAALGLWIAFSGGVAWTWPAVATGEGPAVLPEILRNLPAWFVSVWNQLPAAVQQWMPWACGTAAGLGWAAAMMWRRLSLVLLYSMLGATLLVAAGLATLQYEWPNWMAKIPSQQWAQASILGGVVLVGTLVQWLLIKPVAAGKPAGGGGESKEKSSPPPARKGR